MKIAIVVNEFPSISETFISGKVNELSARGHRLIVFCSKKNEQLFNEFFGSATTIEVVIFNRKTMLLYLLSHPFIVLSNIASRTVKQELFKKFRISNINQRNPDIIHFELSGIGVDYLNELKFLKGRKIVSCRGSAEKVKLLLYDERKKKFRKLMRLVDAVHCVSDDMRKTILPYCDDPEKIFINYPAIDTKYFKTTSIQKRSDFFVLLSIGRFTFQKGYLTGLLAMQALKKSGISFKWMIIGNGPLYKEIVFYIHQLQLQDDVVLMGTKSRREVKEEMAKADIFFLPSVYEGIANVVLEAMSMNLPVVSTKCGGMDEVIIHRKNGLLADVYDHVKLAENILTLVSDSALNESIRQAAAEIVEKQFNIQRQIDKFEHVYDRLVRKSPIVSK